LEYISGLTPIKSLYKGSNLVYQVEESSGDESIVTENTLSFKYRINNSLTTCNVTINGTLYQITAADGEQLEGEYYKYTTTLSEPLTELKFNSGNLFELYAIPQTTNVTTMNQMFYNGLCVSLNLSSLNTSNVTNMQYMFYDCMNLTELNVTGWDVIQISANDSAFMFEGCTSLNKLILGKCSQATYNWWYARLRDSLIQNNVTIEYTIV